MLTWKQKQRKNELQRKRRAEDPVGERIKARKYYRSPSRYESIKRWRKSPKGLAYKRKYSLQMYGITVDDYDNLLKKQNGVCALCLKKETALQYKGGPVRSLNVDHDHRTGKVRGLLCRNCNVALGLLYDDLELFRRIIVYLANV